MTAIPLQARVLDVIRENQPLRRADLVGWLKDVDIVLLEAEVNRLLRANRISLNAGHYDLVAPSKPVNGHAVPAPPTAAEEVA